MFHVFFVTFFCQNSRKYICWNNKSLLKKIIIKENLKEKKLLDWIIGLNWIDFNWNSIDSPKNGLTILATNLLRFKMTSFKITGSMHFDQITIFDLFFTSTKLLSSIFSVFRPHYYLRSFLYFDQITIFDLFCTSTKLLYSIFSVLRTSTSATLLRPL